MKHVSLIAAVLALLLMVSVSAYAADVVQDPLTDETPDIPDWALKPAEDPDDTEDDPTPTPPTDPITVRMRTGISSIRMTVQLRMTPMRKNR